MESAEAIALFVQAVLSLVLLLLIPFLLVVFGALAFVGGQQVAVVERRWIGRKMPEGRVVAMRGEVGIQAHVLGPGMNVLARRRTWWRA